MKSPRVSSHPIDPLFLKRWSPRAFDAQDMPQQDLHTLLEAARWAPSAYNIQPWRFIYARRSDAEWETFVSLLDPFNAGWAHKASALIFLVSDSLFSLEEGQALKKAHYNSFDAGAAWAQLALQATALGYNCHAMAGLLFDDITHKLDIPERYKVEVAIAVGKRSNPLDLPEGLREREEPSPRLELEKIAFQGSFRHA